MYPPVAIKLIRMSIGDADKRQTLAFGGPDLISLAADQPRVTALYKSVNRSAQTRRLFTGKSLVSPTCFLMLFYPNRISLPVIIDNSTLLSLSSADGSFLLELRYKVATVSLIKEICASAGTYRFNDGRR